MWEILTGDFRYVIVVVLVVWAAWIVTESLYDRRQ